LAVRHHWCGGKDRHAEFTPWAQGSPSNHQNFVDSVQCSIGASFANTNADDAIGNVYASAEVSNLGTVRE
jgi:hypothetical protein